MSAKSEEIEELKIYRKLMNVNKVLDFFDDDYLSSEFINSLMYKMSSVIVIFRK